MTVLREKAVLLTGDNLELRIERVAPGKTKIVLEIAGKVQGTIPFDNFLKRNAVLDPESADEQQQQIQALRKQVGELQGVKVDLEAARAQLAGAEGRASDAARKQAAAESELAHVRKTMPVRGQGFEDGRNFERDRIVEHLRSVKGPVIVSASTSPVEVVDGLLIWLLYERPESPHQEEIDRMSAAFRARGHLRPEDVNAAIRNADALLLRGYLTICDQKAVDLRADAMKDLVAGDASSAMRKAGEAQGWERAALEARRVLCAPDAPSDGIVEPFRSVANSPRAFPLRPGALVKLTRDGDEPWMGKEIWVVVKYDEDVEVYELVCPAHLRHDGKASLALAKRESLEVVG